MMSNEGGGGASATTTVSGVMLDEQGSGVPDASVLFRQGLLGEDQMTNTDASGNFSFGAGTVETDVTLAASKASFLSNSIHASLSRRNPNFFIIILTRGINPPVQGNRKPRVNEVTVTPPELDTAGTVTISANITDDDSANIIAVANVHRRETGFVPVVANISLTRAGDTFSGSVRVSTAHSTNQPKTYRVIVAATDAGNGSNETDQRAATLTANPPLAPPGAPSLSRVNSAKRIGR